MTSRVRIVVVDDHPLYREGVARTLSEQDEFDLVGTGETAADARRLAMELQPDVILLDISMPGGGLSALEQIVAETPGVAPVMLTVSESEADVISTLSTGARGYVLKGVSGRELVDIVKSVAQGNSYVAPQLAGQLLVAMQSGKAQGPEAALTAREQDVLKLVAAGRSNKEVALTLDLQEKTVKHHMTSIMSKLKVRNRVEAAVLANSMWPDIKG